MENPRVMSAYLVTLRQRTKKTFDQIAADSYESKTKVHRYFSGDVVNPDTDTLRRIITAAGGSMEEYENYKKGFDRPTSVDAPDADPEGMEEDMKALELVTTMRESFDSMLTRMQAAYDSTIAQLHADHKDALASKDKAIAEHRREKLIIFVLFILVTLFAMYELLFVDAQVGTLGLIRH